MRASNQVIYSHIDSVGVPGTLNGVTVSGQFVVPPELTQRRLYFGFAVAPSTGGELPTEYFVNAQITLSYQSAPVFSWPLYWTEYASGQQAGATFQRQLVPMWRATSHSILDGNLMHCFPPHAGADHLVAVRYFDAAGNYSLMRIEMSPYSLRCTCDTATLTVQARGENAASQWHAVLGLASSEV